MGAEEYLLQIQDITSRIKQRKDQFFELKQTIKTVSGVRYDSIKVVSSASSDAIADKIIRLETIENKIKEDMVLLQEKKAEVMDTIMMVSSPVLRDILIQRYVNIPVDGRMVSFYEIAENINYSYDHTKKLHLRALKKINIALNSPLNDL